MTEGPRIFTIPAGVSFVDALARGLLARSGGDPLALSAATVLLPNHRAITALRDAFLRLGDGQAMLLPAMRPIGEVEDDEIDSALDSGLPDEDTALPPAVPDLERQILLARLVHRFRQAEGAARGADGEGMDQAARLAASLAGLLDELHIHEVPFGRLARVVPDRFAEHWQATLRFLAIIGEHWPAHLEAAGAVDPARRRAERMRRLAGTWMERPPAGPVIIAGSTGSFPQTAALMATVMTLPEGAVVLPGLDTTMDDDTWALLPDDPTHPQHGLAILLARLGIARGAVGRWEEARPATAMRARLIAEAMRPAATTDAWRRLGHDGDGLGEDVLDGLRLVACPDARSEAAVIALMLRETLETPGRTAALVTPDRGLARRVKAELRRWEVDIDDSAGEPLANAPPIAFLRLVAEAARQALAPVPLLAVLKHPLASGGLPAAEFRRRARLLDRQVLRGPRPAPGFDGLLAALGDAERVEERDRLADWLDGLRAPFEPFIAALTAAAVDPAAVLAAHGTLAEFLAASADEPGAARLWRGDAGRQAAAFLGELTGALAGLPAIAGNEYPALFDALLEGRVFRTAWGSHPRLAILGLPEARLQHHDLVILGGLNEGTWPTVPDPGPWLSRPMRGDLNLPPPERRIGLAAHDFQIAASAPEVVLTRAVRVDGAPSVPSRWLLRLETVLSAAGLAGRLGADGDVWVSWAAGLDRPDRVERTAPPAPRPPVEARPRKISVTQVETWMRDPYALYARKVLGLDALDPIDADATVAERGTFIHEALERFARAWPETLPPDPLGELLRTGREVFGPALARPEVWAFWWPRFERIAGWFVELEAGRRAGIAKVETERQGSIQLQGPAGPVTLTGRADRIERGGDGRYTIVDYKTGGVPTRRDREAGLAAQLPLEAAMLAADGFPDLPAAEVAALGYWRLTGGDPPGETVWLEGDPMKDAAEARAGLEQLIAAFDNEDTPYLAVPDPAVAPRWNDYAHLERLAEWSNRSDGET